MGGHGFSTDSLQRVPYSWTCYGSRTRSGGGLSSLNTAANAIRVHLAAHKPLLLTPLVLQRHFLCRVDAWLHPRCPYFSFTGADTKVFPLVPPHPSGSATGDTPPSSDTNKSSGKLLTTTIAPRNVTNLRSTATSPTTASASADSLEARQCDKETRVVHSSSSSSPSSPASSGSTCSVEEMPGTDTPLASLPKLPEFRAAMYDRSEEQQTGPPWRRRSEMETSNAEQVPRRGNLRKSVSTPARDFAAALMDESEEHAAGGTERGTSGAQSFAGSLFSVVRQEGEDPAKRNSWKRQHQMERSLSPGQYMIGIAAEARAWGRALSGNPGAKGTGGGGTTKGDVDPVALLLPEAGQRVGGPAGRGPLLRRLQGDIPGE